jgi:hypothetical protein
MASELTEAAGTATDAGLHHAGITFEAIGVKIYFGAGESRYGSNAARLIYSLKLPIGEGLKLSSGEDTRKMPITLALTRDAAPSQEAIGGLYYMEKYDDDIHAHPAHLLTEIALPEPQFDELFGLAKLGRFPSKLNMEVAGLKYGWAPDGSDKEWDVQKKSNHKLAISHIDFSLPLGGAAINEAAEESGKTIEQPFTRAMAEGLQVQLNSIAASLKWIGFFVFATFLLLIWQAVT